jgi:hypothetical protein
VTWLIAEVLIQINQSASETAAAAKLMHLQFHLPHQCRALIVQTYLTTLGEPDT